MAEDSSELITYLDERFTKIEKVLETKADKVDIQNLMTAVDKYAEKADAYFQEMLMLSQKIDRHEKWLHLVADKLGKKLERIAIKSIDFIKADGVYSEVYMNNTPKIEVRKSLNDWEHILPNESFIRIHRST
ncbi:LytTR family transcriptional regulator, partial [Patescibacteria group bacterium]|nr:LytTR family transcriptional regulator [Patescibacteria group bacterium]